MRTRLIAATMLLIILAVQGTALAIPDLVRLHVIANSDHPHDQRVKELVRDHIVVQLGPVFADMEQEEVCAWILENKGVIQGIAHETLKNAGCDYSVSVKFGVADYPTRLYGKASYPAGKYKSLRIELGDGAGRNWWCIMFPPLCFVEEASQAIEEGQQEAEDSNEVVVKFWLWEKIATFFRRIGGKAR